MNINYLLKPWLSLNDISQEISSLNGDSRNTQQGGLFLAYPGENNDGRNFMHQAIIAGAKVILYETKDLPQNIAIPTNVIAIPLTNLTKLAPLIASRFYGEPSKNLYITGVTGTNGKTTIAYQLALAHANLGQKSAYIGTLGEGEISPLVSDPSKLNSTQNTTPGAIELQSLLHKYHQQNIKQLCMEVSSHALVQNRVSGISFKQAIFTNLSHEHLDYHKNMMNYAKAKALLFHQSTLETAIINIDDPYSKYMLQALPKNIANIIKYGKNKLANLQLLNIRQSLQGSFFSFNSPWGQHSLSLKHLGEFNIYNALAVFASLANLNYPIQAILETLTNLSAPPGRMEITHLEPCIIVDYAHTPDALLNVLKNLQQIKKKRIIAVFGCGGNRDQEKRSLMGKITEIYADIIILTNDNPRTEDPHTIIQHIKDGMKDPIKVFTILDREAAIAKAIAIAEKSDIILVAGKGHEAYQQIGSQKIPFSDCEVIKSLNGLHILPE